VTAWTDLTALSLKIQLLRDMFVSVPSQDQDFYVWYHLKNGTLVMTSSTTKTSSHYIAEILLKVALNTKNLKSKVPMGVSFKTESLIYN
jgi:hypothetical protein